MAELHGLVSRGASIGRARGRRRLPTAAKLQVVTANVDTCNPSRRPESPPSSSPSPTGACARCRDAIERSLVYTADSTMRRLLGDD